MALSRYSICCYNRVCDSIIESQHYLFVFYKLQATRRREGKQRRRGRKETEHLIFVTTPGSVPSAKIFWTSRLLLTWEWWQNSYFCKTKSNHFLTFCMVYYISGKGIKKGYIFNILPCRFRALVKIHTTLSFNKVNLSRHDWLQLLSAATGFSVSLLRSWVLKILY